jgi:hypothetical protein
MPSLLQAAVTNAIDNALKLLGRDSIADQPNQIVAAILLVTIAFPEQPPAVGLTAALRLLTVRRRDHQINDQHFRLEAGRRILSQ